MRKLRRVPLDAGAMEVLLKETLAIVEAGQPQPSAKARRLESDKRWKNLRPATKAEIRRALQQMASGIERCMYCESDTGTDIEHFWPKRLVPCRTFDWNNLLLACSTCNSVHKRDRFPRKLGIPLLVNPVDDEPSDHLALSPKTGHFDDLTDRGATTIDILGLNRTALAKCRQDAWASVQSHIVCYAQARSDNDDARAADMRRVLTRAPHVSVFETLLRLAESNIGRSHIYPVCLRALETHPEIQTWLL